MSDDKPFGFSRAGTRETRSAALLHRFSSPSKTLRSPRGTRRERLRISKLLHTFSEVAIAFNQQTLSVQLIYKCLHITPECRFFNVVAA